MKILGPSWRTKKAVEHEVESDSNRNCCAWKDPKRFGRKIGGNENQRKNRDHLDYSIAKTRQNTEKSFQNPRTLTVTQISVKDYQVMLLWKTRKDDNNSNDNNNDNAVK